MSNEKKLSVSDFKNWLAGVLDFQDEDWTPNLDQWNKILEKVEELDDTLVAPVVVNTSEPAPAPQPAANTQQPAAQPATRHPRPQMDKSVLPADFDKATTKLPDEPIINNKNALQVSQQNVPTVSEEGGQRVRNTGKVYKTPDDQDADYTTSFI